MILYYTQGRLGNQIFQYSFLKNISYKNEYILALGMNDLKDVFDTPKKIINVNKNTYTKYLKVFVYVFRILVKLRLITHIEPNKIKIKDGFVKEGSGIITKKGVLSRIKFVETASYESERYIKSEIKKELSVKKEYIHKAQEFLNELKPGTPVFVHIRLGDYEGYTALGKSVKLPISYYEDAIRIVESRIKDPVFIFLSNDPKKIKDKFNNLKKFVVSNNDFGTDFAIMTLCESAIISASTFSYWRAYLMSESKFVIAPKYWKGFNSNIEYPILGFPSFAEPLKVRYQ